MPPEPTPVSPLTCARCAAELQPGSGAFFQVTVEALADPTPPVCPDADLESIQREIRRLYARLQNLAEEEALGQVYQRLLLYLCVPCYREWIGFLGGMRE